MQGPNLSSWRLQFCCTCISISDLLIFTSAQNPSVSVFSFNLHLWQHIYYSCSCGTEYLRWLQVFIVLDTVLVPEFSIQQTNFIPSLIRLSCYTTGATSQVDNLSILWITIDQDWISKSSPRYKQNNRKELLVLQHIWRNEVETENTFLKNAWGTIHLQNPTPGPSLPGRLSSFFFPSPKLSSLPVMFPQGRIFQLNTCTSVLGTGKCFVELWTKLCSQLHWCKYNEINSLNQYYWS